MPASATDDTTPAGAGPEDTHRPVEPEQPAEAKDPCRRRYADTADKPHARVPRRPPAPRAKIGQQQDNSHRPPWTPRGLDGHRYHPPATATIGCANHPDPLPQPLGDTSAARLFTATATTPEAADQASKHPRAHAPHPNRHRHQHGDQSVTAVLEPFLVPRSEAPHQSRRCCGPYWVGHAGNPPKHSPTNARPPIRAANSDRAATCS